MRGIKIESITKYHSKVIMELVKDFNPNATPQWKYHMDFLNPLLKEIF